MPELFLTQAVSNPETIELIGKFLDQWSSNIPFSPIKQLGSQTQFVSAIGYATYKTTVTTQIEKRWLEDHEEPYHEQELPEKHRPQSEFDPWETDFEFISDFKPHRQSKALFETRRVHECTTCDAVGRVTCSGCDGCGHTTCQKCGGRGQLRRTRDIPRQINCGVCGGSGIGCHGAGSDRCNTCGGKGTTIRFFPEEYYVPCDGCATRGQVACSTCGGDGEVTCPTCQGTTQLMSYTTVEQSEEPVVNDRSRRFRQTQGAGHG